MIPKIYPNYATANVIGFEIPSGSQFHNLIFPVSFKKLTPRSYTSFIIVKENLAKTNVLTPSSGQAMASGIYQFTFPVMDGKSPYTLPISYSVNSPTEIWFIIDEVGGTPDFNYWNDCIGTFKEIQGEMALRITDQPVSVQAQPEATVSFQCDTEGGVISSLWEASYTGIGDWSSVSGSIGKAQISVTAPTIPYTDRYYRRVLTDLNGNVKYSNIAKVTVVPSQSKNTEPYHYNDLAKDGLVNLDDYDELFDENGNERIKEKVEYDVKENEREVTENERTE